MSGFQEILEFRIGHKEGGEGGLGLPGFLCPLLEGLKSGHKEGGGSGPPRILMSTSGGSEIGT